MFIDIDCAQQKKYNQHTYGDYFISKRYPASGRLIAVLSDGLGSGIKANILSCMTSVMLLRFIEAESNIEKACETIMNALPVCKVRGISYATFSAIDCADDGRARIVEEGNPGFIWIRKDQVLKPEGEVIASKTFPSRQMSIYNIQLAENDRLIFCSDGVTQAGLGTAPLRLGVRRTGLIEFLLHRFQSNPRLLSREISRDIVAYAQALEPDRQAQDDISALALHFREPREILVFTGPPYDHNRDNFYAQFFQDFNGRKIICGGSTSNLIARELNLEITSVFSQDDGQLPGVSLMPGVDLVTEGILTLTRAAEYLENSAAQPPGDAAGRLVKFLLDSDCINFLVGAKLNQAHYDPALPVEIEIRRNIIKKLAKLLEQKYLKKVSVQYI